MEETELLEITESALSLAEVFIEKEAVPQTAPEDAIHIAVAVVNGIEGIIGGLIMIKDPIVEEVRKVSTFINFYK